MSMESEVFARYAKAEKELSEIVSPILCGAIRQLERKYGVAIGEFRVTMDKNSGDGWPRANCVLVGAALSARFAQTSPARVASSPMKAFKPVEDLFPLSLANMEAAVR